MLRPNARSLSITSQESYSAVMIADVVADVPVDPETGPEKPKTGPERPKTSSKEETNLGYDGHMDPAPALDSAGSKTNGAGISKGVILNAVQFGPQDSKLDGKSIQLTAPITGPAVVPPPAPGPKGFKDMSFPRKVAFGFSFVPSIMFVLCFAVILPCNVLRPCVEESWIATFNETVAISSLEVSENIVFTASKGVHHVLIQIDPNSGKYNEIILPATPSHLKCGKIMQEDKLDCIVFDESGNISAIRNSSSTVVWNPVSEAEGFPSPPVLLSGCQGEMEDVAVAVSPTKVHILYGATKISDFSTNKSESLCDSVPQKLASWIIKDSSDIVFVCDKDGEDRLVRIPKDIWCAFSKSSVEEPVILKKGTKDSIKSSVFQPFEESLVLWTMNEVSMIQPNGTQLWKMSNLSHNAEGRFILHGNFHEKGKQIALLSSNLESGIKITLLDTSDGSVIKSGSFENTEVTEAVTVQGKKKDFALLLLKKTSTAAFSQINDISTTIVSLISNEEFNAKSSIEVTEELAILDLDGSDQVKDLIKVQEIKKLTDPSYRSRMTVTVDQKKGVVNAYILSTDTNIKTSEVRNINIANWDKSTKPKCL